MILDVLMSSYLGILMSGCLGKLSDEIGWKALVGVLPSTVTSFLRHFPLISSYFDAMVC